MFGIFPKGKISNKRADVHLAHIPPVLRPNLDSTSGADAELPSVTGDLVVHAHLQRRQHRRLAVKTAASNERDTLLDTYAAQGLAHVGQVERHAERLGRLEVDEPRPPRPVAALLRPVLGLAALAPAILHGGVVRPALPRQSRAVGHESHEPLHLETAADPLLILHVQDVARHDLRIEGGVDQRLPHELRQGPVKDLHGLEALDRPPPGGEVDSELCADVAVLQHPDGRLFDDVLRRLRDLRRRLRCDFVW